MVETDNSIKLAVAIALLRSKLSNSSSSSSHSSESNAQRWKRKAKDRKLEILKLEEELKQLEDGSQYDLFPKSASCKCYFFDQIGRSSSRCDDFGDASDFRVKEVLRRRFLRQVRLKGKRRRSDESGLRGRVVDLNIDDEIEQLSTSVDFLVELCKKISPVNNDPFANLSHQAIEFILALLKNLLAEEKNREPTEGIVCSLVVRLVGRMCICSKMHESSDSESDAQFYVQHILRTLGSDPYVGQRTLLALFERIYAVAESLLFMDPFDDAFPDSHDSLFMLIQLSEFLISDHLQTWARNESFEKSLFEEWARSILQARKALSLLESRNGLYMLYMDRVIGELARQIDTISCIHTLDQGILENPLR
ncbi:hypothetical protein Syun_025202 [Stephania yunnanensis]|uniref:Protein MULTIPOLAR SPINDLE 1 n=1 Tax=Stephania yunnanensis TaxID=152371 RepID=A0AAP0HUN8_9MAGN